MASVDFSDYFWGEKNEGFGVLYQNMKGGISAAKELCEFLRERAKLEEDNCKAHSKLSKQLNAGGGTGGTFSPVLLALKVSAEKLSCIHNQWMIKLSELVREVAKYAEEQHKKHKQVKEDESPTLEAVKSIQDTTVLLHKSKETYKQRCLEVEKLKRDGASTKDLEKAEAKFRKAQDDYKTLVDKYCVVRDEFERKMTLAAKHFQQVEAGHLRQMREFVESYCQIVDNNNNQLGRVYQEFQIQLTELTVENLLEQFTLAKHTGLEKPGPVEFDGEKISLASVTGPPSDISDRSGNSNSDKALQQQGQQSTVVGGILGKKESTNSLTGLGAAAAVASGPNSASATPSAAGTSSGAAGKEAEAVSASEAVVVDVVSSTPPPSPVSRSVAGAPPATCTGDNLSTTSSIPEASAEQSPARSPHTRSAGGWTVPGFLKRKGRKKKKNSNAASKDDDGTESVRDIGSDGEDVRKSETPTPEVDDEGYSKQPPTHQKSASGDPWSDFNQSKNNFYSSSDESDDETTKRKIKVEIKPVSNGDAPISASVDELRLVVGGLELPPPPAISKMRPKSALNDRIYSGTQTLRLKTKESRSPLDNLEVGIRRSHSQNQLNKPSQDLLGLSLHPMEPIDPVPPTTTEPDKSSTNDPSAFSSPMSKVNNNVILESSISENPDTSVASTTSKEVQDILGEFTSAQQPALPPKQGNTCNRPNSTQRERISNSLIALPRPPSRMGPVRPRTSPSPASNSSLESSTTRRRSRQDSEGGGKTDHQQVKSEANYDLMRTPSFGLSRGPSPLTLGMSDVVPLAVAFQEVCHACFTGSEESQCQVRLIGDMMISFPAGIVQVVANNPSPAQLTFKIRNAATFESVVPNRQLISLSETLSTGDAKVFEFNMNALRELLKAQSEQNPNAAYFNIDLLKYQVKSKPGAGSCPLQMVAYWKCTDSHTDLRLDYKYNAHAMASPFPLLNMSIAVPIDGGVVNMQSQPTGTWMKENGRALWKFTELSQHSDGNGVGSLRGRFQLSNGPGCQGTIAAQFNCEGTTLSGVDFELMGPGYRLSLVKRRFVSGKYVCDGDANTDTPQSRYAVPPGPQQQQQFSSSESTPAAAQLTLAASQGPSEC